MDSKNKVRRLKPGLMMMTMTMTMIIIIVIIIIYFIIIIIVIVIIIIITIQRYIIIMRARPHQRAQLSFCSRRVSR